MNDSTEYVDKRWDSLGLTKDEVKHIMFLCRKFVNSRDLLEDITQTALIAVYEVLTKYKEEGKEILNRNRFIGKVVLCKLVIDYINSTKKDLLYSTLDVFDDTAEYTDCSSVFRVDTYDEFVDEFNIILDSLDNNIDKFIAYGYHILNMNQEELAECLGVHQSWISTKLKTITQDMQMIYNESK